MTRRNEEQFFEQLADGTPETLAPSRLKSRIYSALMQREAQTGPLRTVTETEAQGRALCVFEKTMEVSPVPDSLQALNFCRVCHARLLGEHVENPPIFWPHCPYVAFKNPGKA